MMEVNGIRIPLAETRRKKSILCVGAKGKCHWATGAIRGKGLVETTPKTPPLVARSRRVYLG